MVTGTAAWRDGQRELIERPSGLSFVSAFVCLEEENATSLWNVYDESLKVLLNLVRINTVFLKSLIILGMYTFSRTKKTLHS